MGTSWLIATKWTLFTVALILFLFREGNCEKMQHDDVTRVANSYFARTSRGSKVCGTDLTELISQVCTHFKDNEKPKRLFSRDVHPKMKVMYGPTDFEDYDEMSNDVAFDKGMFDPSTEYQGLFLKKLYGGAIMPSWKNGKRFRSDRESLVTECCLKPCSYSEMKGYCDGNGGYRGMN